ncbi:hypothetical protein PsAD5_02938 [Pseudovibrio sp. Ad5]|nr:hypothetical protein PsAD5_02938 [Pseudovibrio sp. Ad5]
MFSMSASIQSIVAVAGIDQITVLGSDDVIIPGGAKQLWTSMNITGDLETC